MTDSQLALELVGYVSGAVNARDAHLRLLTRCREAARADAAALLRRRPGQSAVEIVQTDGRPVRKEYVFANAIQAEVTAREIAHEPEAFLFEATACAANLSMGDAADAPIVHLEWDQREVMARETLRALRTALEYARPILDHFKRFDSRITLGPASADLALDEIDQELDTLDAEDLWRSFFMLAGSRARVEAAAWLRVDEGRLEPVQLAGAGWTVENWTFLDRVAEEARPVVLEWQEDSPEAKALAGALAVPVSIAGSPAALLLFRPAEAPFRDVEVRKLAELADAAALSILKAELFARTKLMLVGVPRETLALVESYADAMAPILIRGETGTGKESIARLAHRIGPRHAGPFVPFNCAELVDTLAESQLFGHVRGAFTGATGDQPGIFEQATGGSLFLDEIHLLSTPLQAKFLRAIETAEVRPVGSAGPPKRVEARIVVATNRDLDSMVREGKFLHDLYMRLNVLEVTMTPLRENRRAIPRIAAALLTEACARNRRSLEGFTPRARRAMAAYDYPGNIREMKNIIEKAVVTTAEGLIDVGALPSRMVGTREGDATPAGDGAADFESHRMEAERDYLVKLLKRTRGNVTEAAKVAGLHRTHMYNLMKRHGLSAGAFKT